MQDHVVSFSVFCSHNTTSDIGIITEEVVIQAVRNQAGEKAITTITHCLTILIFVIK